MLQPSQSAFVGDDADELYRRGMAEQAAGRLDAAIGLFDQAMRIRPDFPDALCAGGFILQGQGRAAAALAFYNRALEIDGNHAVALFNSGSLLLEHGNVAEALPRLERACALTPAHAGAHCNRGAAHYALGRLAEAADAYRRAIALNAAMPNAHLNLGNALMKMGRYLDASEAYQRAVDLQPHYPMALCGLGIVNKEMGRFEAAMRAFDRALELEPGLLEGHANRGALDLLLGDFARGWEGYEYRWDEGKRPVPVSPARFDLDALASLAGQKILVVNDHGLGDTIQFFRYVVLLAQAGAAVTFAGPAKMRRLLSSCGVAIEWRDEDDLSGDFDATLAISSLPRACATRLDTIPAPVPYLRAEAERVAFWGERMAGPGPKIGLCWRGNVDFRVDPRRSIPPNKLLPLAQAPLARYFCLQKDPGATELPPALAARTELFGEGFDAGADAFLDTAAAMANLDLIVTCDTSIAHLAGALGRPVWLVLRHISEWRWMTERADSPWYPTMRLFRCAEGDDWEALFKSIAGEIGRTFGEVAEKAASPSCRPPNSGRKMKIDIGCGPNKRQGFLGVDQYGMDGVDVVLDVRQPWPWENESVDEAYSSHFVEHLTAQERVHFYNELHRVLKPGAKATIVTPHWASNRAYGDPTHQWPPVSEMSLAYLNRKWRDANAPHTDAKWNRDGFRCDFDSSWCYSLHPDIGARKPKHQQLAAQWAKDAVLDMFATLTKTQ